MKSRTFEFDLVEAKDEFNIFAASVKKHYPDFYFTCNSRTITDAVVLLIEAVLDYRLHVKFRNTQDNEGFSDFLSLIGENENTYDKILLILNSDIFFKFRNNIRRMLNEAFKVCIDPVFAMWEVRLLDKLTLEVAYNGDYRIHEWHETNNVKSLDADRSHGVDVSQFVKAFKTFVGYSNLDAQIDGVTKQEAIEEIVIEYLKTKLVNTKEEHLYRCLDCFKVFNYNFNPEYAHARLDELYNLYLEEPLSERFDGLKITHWYISINEISVAYGLTTVRIKKRTEQELDDLNQNYVPRSLRKN